MNKDAQKPDVVILSMRRARKQQAMTASKQIAGVLSQAGVRGSVALTLMSDSEFERLKGE